MIFNKLRMRVAQWLVAHALTRPPDFVVIVNGIRYLERWWVIPRNRIFNLYLHRFVNHDDPRALHDHPWWNCSYILGLDSAIRFNFKDDIRGYFEVLPADQKTIPKIAAYKVERYAGQMLFRTGGDAHRVVLHTSTDRIGGDPLPVWSLFITGPVYRKWGFWCPWGWRRFEEYVSLEKDQDGQITSRQGRGCD